MKKLIAFVFAMFLSLFSAQSFATDYQISTLSPTDTYLRNSLANNSFGTEQRLIVGGWGDLYGTLLKFNITSLPNLGTQDTASIWLFNKAPLPSSPPPQPVQVTMYMLDSDFTNVTTSSNFGWSVYTASVFVKTVNVSAYGYWTEFDITNYYKSWKAGTHPNRGILLYPNNTNNYFNFFSSTENANVNERPILRLSGPGQVPDASNTINLKWPLSTAYSTRVVTQPFGADWSTGIKCPVSTGPVKKHNGTDYRAPAGTLVYAADSGIVKVVFASPPWASVITIEHTKLDGSKYTTNYWHVTPYIAVGAQLTKGDLIAEIANIGSSTHFHFTIRDAPYLVNSSGKNVSSVGSLPQADCDGWPAFPEKFIDSESSSVKFQ